MQVTGWYWWYLGGGRWGGRWGGVHSVLIIGSLFFNPLAWVKPTVFICSCNNLPQSIAPAAFKLLWDISGISKWYVLRPNSGHLPSQDTLKSFAMAVTIDCRVWPFSVLRGTGSFGSKNSWILCTVCLAVPDMHFHCLTILIMLFMTIQFKQHHNNLPLARSPNSTKKKSPPIHALAYTDIIGILVYTAVQEYKCDGEHPNGMYTGCDILLMLLTTVSRSTWTDNSRYRKQTESCPVSLHQPSVLKESLKMITVFCLCTHLLFTLSLWMLWLMCYLAFSFASLQVPHFI